MDELQTIVASNEAVINCHEERLKLEAQAEILATKDVGGCETLDCVYERLDAMDASTAEKRAAKIYIRLGYNR
ncbi:ABC transporter [Artemisia annua]|uniref:ABC transporter n=1 Tax=Artemisia annua TaxID=35608 RepID=A0A2U1QKD8_ARTAN|nr:ABC transporter [Artemisia annua]